MSHDCRLKALKAVEKLVSLLSNQPEEVQYHNYITTNNKYNIGIDQCYWCYC